MRPLCKLVSHADHAPIIVHRHGPGEGRCTPAFPVGVTCTWQNGCPAGKYSALCPSASVRDGLGYDAVLLEAIQAETRQMTLGEKIVEVQALRAGRGAPEGNQNAAKNKGDDDNVCFIEQPSGAWQK